MRIAAIIPGLPEPADRGTYKRYAALIAALSRLGQVDLVTLVDQELAAGAQATMATRVHRLHAPTVAFQPWKSWWRQCLDALPPHVRHWHDPAIRDGIRAFFAGQRYDIVMLGDLVSVPYAEHAGLCRFPVWLDRARVDVEYQRQKDALANLGTAARVTAALRRRMTARYERAVSRLAQGQIVCAASDATALRRVLPAHSAMTIDVVANGIERSQFPDQGALTSDPVFMFAGAMDYQPNVDGALWFITDIWPRIRAQRPDAVLHVVGRNPVDAVRAHHGHDGITVTGEVASMLPAYKQARVVVAPIRIGGGTRLKVVEAWSVGRPLVSTQIGVDGLEAREGDNALIADTHDAFAAAALRALEPDVAERLRVGAMATAAVYDWETVWAPQEARWRARYGAQG